jgi:amino acid efflux transporter
MTISTVRGVALYAGALLGPGLLVLPGLAVTVAGPASILAWIGLLALSGLVAIVFARLGVAHPGGGGVAAYARAGLGARAGRAVGWCFLAGIVSGAPMVCVMGAGYPGDLLGLGRGATAAVGAVLLAVVLVVSHRGVRTSATVQLGLIAVLLVLIVAAVGSAAPAARAANWTPFAPHGWTAIGAAAAALMLSFVGWEAIAPLSDRFADPARQLPRVIGTAFALTAVVYLSLAAVTVGALGAGSAVPLADLLSLGLGRAGAVVAAAGALLLTLGTVNAYLTGGAALARTLTANPAGAFPGWFRTAIIASGVAGTTLIGAGRIHVATAIAVPSMCFLLVYLGCTVAAVRLLTGPARAAAVTATVIILVVLAFAGWAVLPALVVALAAGTTKTIATDRTKISDPPRLHR